MLEYSDDEINRGYSGLKRYVDLVEKGEGNSRFCLNDFFFSEINGFEKPHEARTVRSLVLVATILDSGQGNNRPMCKLGVRVNLPHIY